MADGPFAPVRSYASQQLQVQQAENLLQSNRGRITALEDQIASIKKPFSKSSRESIMKFLNSSTLFQQNRARQVAGRLGASYDMVQEEANRQLKLRGIRSNLEEQERASRIPSILERAGVASSLGAMNLGLSTGESQIRASTPLESATPGTMEQVSEQLIKLAMIAAATSAGGPGAGAAAAGATSGFSTTQQGGFSLASFGRPRG